MQAKKKVSLAESKQLTHEVGRPEKWKQNIEVLKDVCNPLLCVLILMRFELMNIHSKRLCDVCQ